MTPFSTIWCEKGLVPSSDQYSHREMTEREIKLKPRKKTHAKKVGRPRTYFANLRRFIACKRTSAFCSLERRSVTSRRLASRIRGLMTSLEGGAGIVVNVGAGRAKCLEGSWCGCECGCWGAMAVPSQRCVLFLASLYDEQRPRGSKKNNQPSRTDGCGKWLLK